MNPIPGLKFLKPLLVTLVTGSLILYFVQLDLSRCQDYLARLTLPLILFLVLFSLLRVVLRAMRMRILLPEAPPWPRLSAFFLLHQFFATLLPFKLGEMALPVLLKQTGIPLARSLAALMLVRLLDLGALALYMLALMELFRPLWPPFVVAVWPALVVSLWGILLGVVLLVGVRGGLVDLLERMIDHPWGRWLPRRTWLRERWTVFREGMCDIPPARIVRVVLFSLLLQVQGVIITVVLFAWLEPALSWSTVVVGESLINIANLIPIQGFAALGTYEGLFVMIFASLGLRDSDALALAIVGHLLQIALVVPLGLLGARFLNHGDKEPTRSSGGL